MHYKEIKVSLSRSHAARSSLYISQVKHKVVVIPAGMPESSAMDGNLLVPKVLNRREVPAYSFTSMWLDSGIPGGMTGLETLVYNDERGAWVSNKSVC